MFQCEAAKTLNLISCDDDDLDNAIHKVGKQITKECLSMKTRRTEYCMHIDKAMAQDCVSSTLLKVLNSISEQFDISLPGIMVGNIVTSVVTKNPTALQIALGVLFGDHKTLLSELYKYGVVCSYYEVLRYKRSAAVAAAASEVSAGMLDADHGMVQVVVDHFDAVIHSQNCKMMCHSVAMVMTQSSSSEQNDKKCVDNDVFPRISKTEMSQPIQYEVEVQAYQGPKKPPMPMQAATQLVPTLAVLAKSVLSQKRSSENDFGFLQDVVTSPDCPEFNGYNTRLCREAGMLPRPCTRITYLPLIDMTPSDPSTMLTAINQGGKLTSDTGQNALIITCDQQLYTVVVDILFDHPMLLPDVIPILGGMHLLMSFIGSIGVLMEGTGLQDLLIPSFGSVDKMLSGKKFPQNMRALRLLMEKNPPTSIWMWSLNKNGRIAWSTTGSVKQEQDSKSLGWSVYHACAYHDAVLRSSSRRWLVASCPFCETNTPLHVCRRSSKLCTLWRVLSTLYEPPASWCSAKVHKWWANHAPQPGNLEWSVVWYVYWDHIHALWAWSIRHNWHHNQTRNTEDMGPQYACMYHTDHRPTRYGWQQIRCSKIYSQGGNISSHQGRCIRSSISSSNPHHMHWSSESWRPSSGFNHQHCHRQNRFSWSECRWSSPNRKRSNDNISNRVARNILQQNFQRSENMCITQKEAAHWRHSCDWSGSYLRSGDWVINQQ